MHASESLEPLIDMLCEVDAEKWPPLFTALTQALGGTLLTLFLHNTRVHSGALANHAGYDTCTSGLNQGHFAARNVWLRGGLHLLQPGQVRTSHMMCSRPEFLRGEFYADYCRPLGISQGIGG